MSDELAALIAKHFIARRDAKAIQHLDGTYAPVTTGPREARTPVPFRMDDLRAHLAGTTTYGHYLLDTSSQVKFFAFDCDLNEGDCGLRTRDHFPPCCQEGHGSWIAPANLEQLPPGIVAATRDADEWFAANSQVYPARPRENWRDRAHPGRGWWKYQMRTLGDMLASRIRSALEIPALVTYTGSKGIHVYGFTGLMPAQDARDAALLVLRSLGRFNPKAGSNFWYDSSTDWYDSYYNWTIEVFPKQTEVRPDGYGNLMRLPFGRNHKGRDQHGNYDPTFIIDTTAPQTVLAPVADPVRVLSQTLGPVA